MAGAQNGDKTGVWGSGACGRRIAGCPQQHRRRDRSSESQTAKVRETAVALGEVGESQ